MFSSGDEGFLTSLPVDVRDQILMQVLETTKEQNKQALRKKKQYIYKKKKKKKKIRFMMVLNTNCYFPGSGAKNLTRLEKGSYSQVQECRSNK